MYDEKVTQAMTKRNKLVFHNMLSHLKKAKTGVEKDQSRVVFVFAIM